MEYCESFLLCECKFSDDFEGILNSLIGWNLLILEAEFGNDPETVWLETYTDTLEVSRRFHAVKQYCSLFTIIFSENITEIQACSIKIYYK